MDFKQRHLEMLARLQKMEGIELYEVQGRDDTDDEEKGFLVVNHRLDKEEEFQRNLREIANHFVQDSVSICIRGENKIIFRNNLILKGKGYQYVQRNRFFYTAIQLTNRRTVRFALNIDETAADAAMQSKDENYWLEKYNEGYEILDRGELKKAELIISEMKSAGVPFYQLLENRYWNLLRFRGEKDLAKRRFRPVERIMDRMKSGFNAETAYFFLKRAYWKTKGEVAREAIAEDKFDVAKEIMKQMNDDSSTRLELLMLREAYCSARMKQGEQAIDDDNIKKLKIIIDDFKDINSITSLLNDIPDYYKGLVSTFFNKYSTVVQYLQMKLASVDPHKSGDENVIKSLGLEPSRITNYPISNEEILKNSGQTISDEALELIVYLGAKDWKINIAFKDMPETLEIEGKNVSFNNWSGVISRSANPAMNSAQKHIVIFVDDKLTEIERFKQYAQGNSSYEFRDFLTQEEALKFIKINHQRIGLVISDTDNKRTDMQGPEFAEIMRKDFPQVSFVAVSGAKVNEGRYAAFLGMPFYHKRIGSEWWDMIIKNHFRKSKAIYPGNEIKLADIQLFARRTITRRLFQSPPFLDAESLPNEFKKLPNGYRAYNEKGKAREEFHKLLAQNNQWIKDPGRQSKDNKKQVFVLNTNGDLLKNFPGEATAVLLFLDEENKNYYFVINNPAMSVRESNKGGIDLNPAQMSMQIKKEGEDFKFNFNGTEINAAQLTGVTFAIRTITPVTNLPAELGLNTEPTDKPKLKVFTT